MRLIDADALSKRLQKLWDIHDDTDFANKDVWQELENAPSIDAVPVVRCKDCKYAHMTYDGDCKYCDVWFPDEAEYLDGDYYCASAEMKEETCNNTEE